MKFTDEIDILECRVRGLENETRTLRHALRDDYFCAALTGLLSRGWQPFDMAIAESWKIADTALQQREDYAR